MNSDGSGGRNTDTMPALPEVIEADEPPICPTRQRHYVTEGFTTTTTRHSMVDTAANRRAAQSPGIPGVGQIAVHANLAAIPNALGARNYGLVLAFDLF